MRENYELKVSTRFIKKQNLYGGNTAFGYLTQILIQLG